MTATISKVCIVALKLAGVSDILHRVVYIELPVEFECFTKTTDVNIESVANQTYNITVTATLCNGSKPITGELI